MAQQTTIPFSEFFIPFAVSVQQPLNAMYEQTKALQ
jgi:hypothetical protein